MIKRLLPYANKIVGKYQSGFCRHKLTVDQLFSIRKMLEKIISHVNIISKRITYLSTSKRRTTVSTGKHYCHAMFEFDISLHLVKLIPETLIGAESCVRVQNNFSSPFNTNVGIQQGDLLPCIIFNIALKK